MYIRANSNVFDIVKNVKNRVNPQRSIHSGYVFNDHRNPIYNKTYFNKRIELSRVAH